MAGCVRSPCGREGKFAINASTLRGYALPLLEQVKAVAAFPPELQGALEASKGKTVVFSGEILKFEPFAHELYLQNAALKS